MLSSMVSSGMALHGCGNDAPQRFRSGQVTVLSALLSSGVAASRRQQSEQEDLDLDNPSW